MIIHLLHTSSSSNSVTLPSGSLTTIALAVAAIVVVMFSLLALSLNFQS